MTATNALTQEDMLACARELGEQSGKGKDTQVKALLKCMEAGYHGLYDLKPNKHGSGIDDATNFAREYVKAQNNAVIFDPKAPNQAKLVSCNRTIIKLGTWPKGGNGEPLATVNNLMTIRQNLKKIPAEAKRLDDAANTLLKYARAQLRADKLIGDEELKQMCFKKRKDAATEEEQIEAVKKKLDKLISEGNRSANLMAARHSMQKELAAIATAKNPQVKAPAQATLTAAA